MTLRRFTLGVVIVCGTAGLGCGPLFPGPDAGTSAFCGPSTCSGCCLNGVCQGGTARSACGTQGLACVDCGDRTCTPNGCEAPDASLPWEEGSCGDAPTLVFDGGVAVFEGDTRHHANHMSNSCGGDKAGDQVVHIDTPAFRFLELEAEPLSDDFAPLLYGHSACSSGYVYPCSSHAEPGATARSEFITLAHDAYIWVDGADSRTGPYRLTAKLPGEACEDPIPPRAFPSDTDAARLSVLGARNDSSGSCGGDGPDLAIRVDITEPSSLFAEAKVPSLSGAVPVLYLRRGCGEDAVELACDTAWASTARLKVGDLSPGTYFLWLDDESAGGAVDVTLDVRPTVSGDACANPRKITVPAGGAVISDAISGDLLTGTHAFTCGAPSTVDAVYELTTETTLDLDIEASPSNVIAVQGPSCDGPTRGCTDYGRLHVGALPPGTWYVWIGLSSFSNVTFTLKPPQAGDACFAPLPLSFTGGGAGGDATAQGTTAPLHDDAASSCGGPGPDVVYHFNTTQTLDLRATVNSGFATRLYLRSACDGPELACTPTPVTYGGSLEVGTLPAGDYWLWIDSDHTSGQYVLNASLTPPAQGDTCLSPTPIALAPVTDGGTGASASVTGSTIGLFNNGFGSCGGSGSRDAVHELTLAQPAAVTFAASATHGSGLQPVVYVRSACESSEVACSSAVAQSGIASLSTSLPAGTWFVWVDGLAGTSGSYELVVSTD